MDQKWYCCDLCQSVLPVFSSKSFVVSGLIFRSLNYSLQTFQRRKLRFKRTNRGLIHVGRNGERRKDWREEPREETRVGHVDQKRGTIFRMLPKHTHAARTPCFLPVHPNWETEREVSPWSPDFTLPSFSASKLILLVVPWDLWWPVFPEVLNMWSQKSFLASVLKEFSTMKWTFLWDKNFQRISFHVYFIYSAQ